MNGDEIVWDIETNGFLEEMTTIHCLNTINVTTGQRLRFNGGVYADGTPAYRDGTIEEGIALIENSGLSIGHNIVRFDIPGVRKLNPSFQPKGKIRDTMVISRLIWPNMGEIDAKAMRANKRPPSFSGAHVGSHALKAWGFRLGDYKGDFEGPFDLFTQEMDDYCAQDVEVNLKLWQKIKEKNYSEDAIELETRVAELIFLQEQNGFVFNIPLAEKLTAELSRIRAELDAEVRSSFDPWYSPELKHGKHVVFYPKRPNKAMGYEVDAPFTKVKLNVFNPSSRDHISERMQVLFNWEPAEFTEGGKPKVDETTLASLPYPEAKLLVKYLTVQKRLSQLAEGDNAWLNRVQPDGRIHGAVNPMGAVTGRMTHFSPNVAQVPKCGSLWGAECRELWGPREGWLQVGCDAEGLELRMLGHYLFRYDQGAYAFSVVDGKKEDETDVHNMNRKAIGMRIRDNAKTFISMG
jgi:DNA polymerase-1